MKDLLGLRGKVAIVTGASSGIGYAAAIRLAQAGCDLVLVARRAGKLTRLEAKIKKMGRRAISIPTDVSVKKEVDEMVKQVVKKFGRIDILVNNAGILDSEPFLKITEERLRKVLDINLIGQLLVAQAVGKVMVKKKSGRIVNTASVAGFQASAGITSYNLSKTGIVMLTKNMAMELSPMGIYVNAVAPGLIETEMTASMVGDRKTVKGYLEKIPLGRVGQAVDMANIILFLSSDLCSYITGETIIADGGWTIHL